MVRIKICGLSSIDNAGIAVEYGADMIGVLVNVKVSTPREIGLDRAKQIFDSINSDVDKVVVTMPDSADEVISLDKEINPDFYQIHNSLPASELVRIKRNTKAKIIGVESVSKKQSDYEELVSSSKKTAYASDFLLLDTKTSSGGGSGETHDWEASLAVKESLDTPLFLAGGLAPANVQEAIEKVKPFGVDASSCLESELGEKNPELIRKFINGADG